MHFVSARSPYSAELASKFFTNTSVANCRTWLRSTKNCVCRLKTTRSSYLAQVARTHVSERFRSKHHHHSILISASTDYHRIIVLASSRHYLVNTFISSSWTRGGRRQRERERESERGRREEREREGEREGERRERWLRLRGWPLLVMGKSGAVRNNNRAKWRAVRSPAGPPLR